MTKAKVGDRVIIVKAEGHTIGKVKLPLRDPHPEHIGKSGTIIKIDSEDGMPTIRLDDGYELEGCDCWWQKKETKKSIIKFGPSFRQSARENLGLSEESVRQIELDTIKSQKKLREGIDEEVNNGKDNNL